MTEFVGLSEQKSDLLEKEEVYFYFVGTYPDDSPKAIAHGLYRYRTARQATSEFERLLQEIHAAPLGRFTPIVGQSEMSFRSVKGQIIETSDPVGAAYWFIGKHGDTLMVLVTLGPDHSGQKQLLETVLPVLVERLSKAQ